MKTMSIKIRGNDFLEKRFVLRMIRRNFKNDAKGCRTDYDVTEFADDPDAPSVQTQRKILDKKVGVEDVLNVVKILEESKYTKEETERKKELREDYYVFMILPKGFHKINEKYGLKRLDEDGGDEDEREYAIKKRMMDREKEGVLKTLGEKIEGMTLAKEIKEPEPIKTIEILKEKLYYKVIVNGIYFLKPIRKKNAEEKNKKAYWDYIDEIANEGKSWVDFDKLTGVQSWFRDTKENPIYIQTGLSVTTILSYYDEELISAPGIDIKNISSSKYEARKKSS